MGQVKHRVRPGQNNDNQKAQTLPEQGLLPIKGLLRRRSSCRRHIHQLHQNRSGAGLQSFFGGGRAAKNPKAETRRPKEGRSPKSEPAYRLPKLLRAWPPARQLRISAFGPLLTSARFSSRPSPPRRDTGRRNPFARATESD